MKWSLHESILGLYVTNGGRYQAMNCMRLLDNIFGLGGRFDTDWLALKGSFPVVYICTERYDGYWQYNTRHEMALQLILPRAVPNASLLGLALSSADAARESSQIPGKGVPALVPWCGPQAAAGGAFNATSRPC